MRPLRPNSQGALVPTKSALGTTRPEAPFSRPCSALQKIDKQRQGEPPSILLVRSRGGIGDLLMTTPTARAISNKYHCKIDYCTDYRYLDGALPKTLQYISYIGDVFDVEALSGRQEDYDAVINLTCPCTSHEKPLAPPINRIDLFARHATISLTDQKMDYVIAPAELEWAREYLTQNNLIKHKLVLVQPSSSHTQRDAPFSKVITAINTMTKIDPELRFLIITHNSDNVKTTWDLYHSWTLKDMDVRQLSAIMSYCDLVLCPDSAVLHMASAQSKKTVTLFGPTDPRARVNYHPEAVAIWPAKNLHNYPCLTKDALVKTKEGYKPICDIRIGEYVKTADNYRTDGQYHRVIETHKNPLGQRALHQLTVFGSIHRPIVATEDHKFLVSQKARVTRDRVRDSVTGKWLSKPTDECRESYEMMMPKWYEARDITTDHYLCIPRNRPCLPAQEFERPEFSPEACWIYGLYLAEGYLKNASSGAKQIMLSGNIDESDIDKRLSFSLNKAFGIKHHQVEIVKRHTQTVCQDNHKTVNRIITNQSLFALMEGFFGLGTTAHTKSIPSIFYHLPDDSLQALLEGIRAGDGYAYNHNQSTVHIISTVSEQLAYGIQELYSRFGQLAKVYRYERNTNLKQDTHIFRINIAATSSRSRSVCDEEYIYVPLIDNRVVDPTGIDYVYDLTVENDTTFTVNNLATWDCWYSDPHDGYLCWKILEPQAIIDACMSLLTDSPLPSSIDLVTFGTYRRVASTYEII